MAKPLELVGKRFGKLVVIRRVASNKRGSSRWMCKCDCGKDHVTLGTLLNTGSVQSCGCLALAVRTKHNMHKTRIYSIWTGIKGRTNTPSFSGYQNYGGRGIKMCDEWANDFPTFYNWAKVSGYADDLTIERIDVDGDYTPSNCRWATRLEQGNNKRNTRKLTYNDRSMTAAEWSRYLGGAKNLVKHRLEKGWSEEEALSTPVNKKFRKKS